MRPMIGHEAPPELRSVLSTWQLRRRRDRLRQRLTDVGVCLVWILAALVFAFRVGWLGV